MTASAPGPRGLPWGRFLVVAVAVVIDQVTKRAVFGWLEDPGSVQGVVRDLHGHERYPIAGDWLGLMLSCNPGAAFGRFGEYPHLLVGGRVVAVGVLTWLLWAADLRHRWVLVAIVLVLAGALGNLIDNLGQGCIEEGHPYGLVRDFIDVWFRSEAWGWDWHFPTFNVADSCITVGAALWILSGFFQRDADEAEAEPGGEEEPAPESEPVVR